MENNKKMKAKMKKKFGGKYFALHTIEVDSPRDAQRLAKNLRKQGYLVRVTSHSYSPPRGREFNAYKVWKRRKRG